MTTLPAGYYAVEDPDVPGRWTYWTVDRRGVVRDYAERWRPLPPPGLTREQKQDWYAEGGPYRLWRAEVARRIASDPVGAAARFHARYPDPVDLPAPRVRPPRPAKPVTPEDVQARVRRHAEALVVAGLRANGASFRDIAATLGMPLSRAHRRAQVGRALMSVRSGDQLAGQLARLQELLDDDGRAAWRAALAALTGQQSADDGPDA